MRQRPLQKKLEKNTCYGKNTEDYQVDGLKWSEMQNYTQKNNWTKSDLDAKGNIDRKNCIFLDTSMSNERRKSKLWCQEYWMALTREEGHTENGVMKLSNGAWKQPWERSKLQSSKYSAEGTGNRPWGWHQTPMNAGPMVNDDDYYERK